MNHRLSQRINANTIEVVIDAGDRRDCSLLDTYGIDSTLQTMELQLVLLPVRTSQPILA